VAQAVAMLDGTEVAVLCGTPAPVAFFAYPGRPSLVLPEACATLALAAPEADVPAALAALEAALGPGRARPALEARGETVRPRGALTLDAVGAVLHAMLPEGAVVVDESISASFTLLPWLRRAAPFDHLQLTGGAIGIGMPLAAGAAVGAPGRKVVNLEADGSGLYTLQALWTQAREGADVLTVVLANRSYATLHGELAAMGVNAPGPNARALFDLDRPVIDWTALARGLGVEARRADTAEAFAAALKAGLRAEGPFLVEAVLDAAPGR
jgi:acetolactate synthase I/II/III large subunit